MKNAARLIVACLAILGCFGLLAGDAAASMYDTGDRQPAQVTPPQDAQCGSPPPMMCGPYPYGPYVIMYPRRGYGTYLDDTRKGIQYLDISGGM